MLSNLRWFHISGMFILLGYVHWYGAHLLIKEIVVNYQRQAWQFDRTPDSVDRVMYMPLALASEVGEFCEKIKKIYRDNPGVVVDGILVDDKVRADLGGELGDIAWYLAACCTVLGLRLDSVMTDNIVKLSDRAERGVIHGSGDNR